MNDDGSLSFINWVFKDISHVFVVDLFHVFGHFNDLGCKIQQLFFTRQMANCLRGAFLKSQFQCLWWLLAPFMGLITSHKTQICTKLMTPGNLRICNFACKSVFLENQKVLGKPNWTGILKFPVTNTVILIIQTQHMSRFGFN